MHMKRGTCLIHKREERNKMRRDHRCLRKRRRAKMRTMRRGDAKQERLKKRCK